MAQDTVTDSGAGGNFPVIQSRLEPDCFISLVDVYPKVESQLFLSAVRPPPGGMRLKIIKLN